MAIQQVTATINVAVQGLQSLQQLSALYNQTGQAAQNAQNRVNQAGQAMGNATRQATAFTGSIARLTQSMVLFSVLLPVVRLPQTAIKSFQDMVDVGTEWEHQIRSINSLLALQGDQYNAMNNQMKTLATTYGLTTEEVGNAGKQIASTLGVVQRNTAGMTEAQRATDDYNTSMILMDKIAKLSRASFEDMNTVTEAAFTIMATGKLTLDQADDAFNELFKTVQIGRTTFSQFNQDAGKFMPLAEEWIQTADTAGERFQRMTGALDAFAAASNSLGSARAATGIGRIFQSIAGTSAQQQQMIAQIEAFRKRAGLGQEYNITPQALFATGDVQQIFTKLQNVLGPSSPLITQQIETMRKRGTLQDESAARAELAQKLQRRYFEQVQAIRAFQAATPEQIAEMQRMRAAAPGEQAGYEEFLKDPAGAAQRMNAAWTTLKASVFEGIQTDLVRLNIGFANLFETINKGLEDKQNLGLADRLRYIFGEVGKAFTNWYTTGGKAQIEQWGHMLGAGIAQALTDFFTGDEGKNAAADAARSFVVAFIDGVRENLLQLLGAALQSSIVRAAALFFATRGTIGARGAGALAAGSLAVPSGGPVSGALTAGLIGVSALGMFGGSGANTNLIGWLTGAATRNAGLRGAVQAAGGAGPLAAQLGVSPTTINRWLAGTQTPSAANLAAINAITGGGGVRGSLGLGARAAQAGARTFGRGNLALSGLMAALGVYQAVTGPENERGAGIGSAIGGVLGTLGGGFLGSLVAPGVGTVVGGAAGGMAGSALGGMAGDWIQRNLFGAQPQLATGGTGLGPGTEAADDLASIYMTGINASDAVTQLEQINRKMDRPGSALTGGTTSRTTSAAGLGLASKPAPGTLEQAFTSQFSDPTLTTSQANSACGPAAVSFFVKAYGRNPTLAEAYALQNQIQGGGTPGFDIANNQGSNIAAMGQAITKLGGPAAEVYQGSNIDWGRLAENAKAGIPGIVNIGPSGSFPGHYYQIGGYNPANNTFQVGSNVMKGEGAWLTPEQMMAHGPAMGAIYGLQPTKLSGGVTPGNLGAVSGTGGGVDPGIISAIAGTETGSIGKSKGQLTLGISTAALSGKGTSGMSWGTGTPGAVAAGQPGAFWAYQSRDEAAAAFKNYIHTNMPNLEPYLGDSQKFFQAMIDTQSNYYVPMAGGMSKTAYYQRWKEMAAQGTGFGPGGGGGAINVNGNLIGTVILGGGATQDDADQLAAMIADALENLAATGGGGTIGQNKMFKQ